MSKAAPRSLRHANRSRPVSPPARQTGRFRKAVRNRTYAKRIWRDRNAAGAPFPISCGSPPTAADQFVENERVPLVRRCIVPPQLRRSPATGEDHDVILGPAEQGVAALSGDYKTATCLREGVLGRDASIDHRHMMRRRESFMHALELVRGKFHLTNSGAALLCHVMGVAAFTFAEIILNVAAVSQCQQFRAPSARVESARHDRRIKTSRTPDVDFIRTRRQSRYFVLYRPLEIG